MTDRQTLHNTSRICGIEFDIRQTNIAKGIAVLLLLWHHLFYDKLEYYSRFTSLFMVNDSIPIECILARFCKVCVAIFLFLSGYGLLKSWQKKQETIIRGNNKVAIKDYLIFMKNHLLKLMFNYWFIFLLFVPLGIFFGREFWVIYEGRKLYGIIDFLGLANLFDTPTMNGTWWYMSLIILIYILFPIFLLMLKWSPELLLSLALINVIWEYIPYAPEIPLINNYLIWFSVFILGMYFSELSIFERLSKRNGTVLKGLLISVVGILSFAILRGEVNHNYYFDSLFGFSIILFSFLIVSKIPIINRVFEKLGEHSASIFMFHTFIFNYYFKDFIYWFKYAPIIFIVLTGICYVIAVFIDFIVRKILKHYLLKT